MKTGSSSFSNTISDLIKKSGTPSCEDSRPSLHVSKEEDYDRWRGMWAANNTFGDLWVANHELSFGEISKLRQERFPDIRNVFCVTILRSPLNWLRSRYQHGHRAVANKHTAENISDWVIGNGLHYMGTHYTFALPKEMRDTYMSWNQRIMLSTSNKRKLQAKEKASLYPTPTDDVVLWFAINMDFDAAEQHLRQNYMVLLTEYLNLGVSLFSLAMCGNPESLKKQHKMINKISEIREADDERYSFSAEQIRDLTPILAPYEALYGVYSKIFYEDVAKYLGGLEEEQVA